MKKNISLILCIIVKEKENNIRLLEHCYILQLYFLEFIDAYIRLIGNSSESSTTSQSVTKFIFISGKFEQNA